MWNSQLLVICCGREGGVRGRGIPSREGAVESRGHSLWHTNTHSHASTHMKTFSRTHAGCGCVATGANEGEKHLETEADRGDPK